MSTKTKEKSPTKVVTGPVRLSYAHVWEPTAIDDAEGAEKKYSCCLIIPKSDTKTLDKLETAIDVIKKTTGKEKWGGKVPAKLKTPLRDGDEERPEDPAFANAYFLNANSKTKPGIVDKDLDEILDKDEVYSGCFAKVSVNLYPFDFKGTRGIAVGLNHIMKLKDGDPLTARTSAEDDFADEMDDVDDVDDADDMM